MRETPLVKVMTAPVETIDVEDSLSRVEFKLRQKGIRHLPVVGKDKRLVGLITQRDLYRTLAPRKTVDDGIYYDPELLNGFVLKHIMTGSPKTLGPKDSIARAVELMAEHKYGCIPIVDASKGVIGIVTEIDILKFVAQNM